MISEQHVKEYYNNCLLRLRELYVVGVNNGGKMTTELSLDISSISGQAFACGVILGLTLEQVQQDIESHIPNDESTK